MQWIEDSTIITFSRGNDSLDYWTRQIREFVQKHRVYSVLGISNDTVLIHYDEVEHRCCKCHKDLKYDTRFSRWENGKTLYYCQPCDTPEPKLTDIGDMIAEVARIV